MTCEEMLDQAVTVLQVARQQCLGRVYMTMQA